MAVGAVGAVGVAGVALTIQSYQTAVAVEEPVVCLLTQSYHCPVQVCHPESQILLVGCQTVTAAVLELEHPTVAVGESFPVMVVAAVVVSIASVVLVVQQD